MTIDTVFMAAGLAVAGVLHAVTTFQVGKSLRIHLQTPSKETAWIRRIIAGMIMLLWAMMLMAVWVIYKGG